MSKLNFSISGNSITATRYDGKARHFSLVVDEPEELGGQDSAPNPVEYLLAAYAGTFHHRRLIKREVRVSVLSLIKFEEENGQGVKKEEIKSQPRLQKAAM